MSINSLEAGHPACYGLKGPQTYVIGSDFMSGADAEDLALFNWTAGGGGSVPTGASIQDEVGGAIILTTDADDTDYMSGVGSGESILLEVNKRYVFVAKFQGDVANAADYWIGIAAKGATDPAGTVPVEGMVFRKDDGGVLLDWSVYNASSADDETSIATGFTADTYYKVAFEIFMGDTAGYGRVKVYVDDKKVHDEFYTGLPTDEMGLLVGVETGATAAVVMKIDYIYFYGER